MDTLSAGTVAVKKSLVPAFLPHYGLLDIIGHRKPFAGLLEAVLALWHGHEVPALYLHAEDETKEFWRPATRTTRRIAFMAHLLGIARAGSYPFIGLDSRCRCDTTHHTCDGLGARYLCIDIDDHYGEGGVGQFLVRVVAACRAVGFRPILFSSRSGIGVHVYIFADDVITAAEAHAVGAAIRHAAGVPARRCDIIPSVKHTRGYGTLHAMPLHPDDAANMGGMLLDEKHRPVIDYAHIVRALVQADLERSSAARMREVAADPSIVVNALHAFDPAMPVTQTRHRRASPVHLPVMDSEGDEAIIEAMRVSHPQFMSALRATHWRGGRSTRDAYIARMLARQGVSVPGIVAVLKGVPGSKAATRTDDYADDVARWVAQTEEVLPPDMPGMTTATRQAGPWAFRVAPPAAYTAPNPFYLASVQERLARSRTARVDGPVIAFIIAFWFWGRGLHPRRQFYLGARAASKALAMPVRSWIRAVDRVATQYRDIIRVTPGRPGHDVLRIANAYDLVGFDSADQIDWYGTSVQGDHQRVQCASDDDLPPAYVYCRHDRA